MQVWYTFGFVDLCGFTHLFETDDVAALHTLICFRSVLRDTCIVHGVRLEKWLGDGALLVATSPSAMAAAITETARILDPHQHLPIRAGVAAGTAVLLDGDELIGRPVNLAARLCEHAAAHELLSTAGLLRTGTTERILDVRGFADAQPVDVTPLGSSTSPAAGLHPTC